MRRRWGSFYRAERPDSNQGAERHPVAPELGAGRSDYRRPMSEAGLEQAPQASAQVADVGSLGHIGALDGIRAVAVIAVMAFHGEVAGTRGGFLGVSVFFALSGFLITSLLVRERLDAPTASIDLRRFYSRRFRRLLPASWCTIGLVVVMGALGVWDDQQLRLLRGDVPWTLAELANWHFIAEGTTYGASQSTPSPLEHFWSLAIEQQFYVVLPLLVVAVLSVRLAHRQRLLVLAGVFGVLVVASAVANGLAARSSVDRAYFGTDTRAAELLVGSLLALAMLRRLPRPPSRRSSTPIDLVGVLGLVVLGSLVHIARLDSSWLYPWGLLVTAAATAAVIVAASDRGLVARLLEWTPFLLLGRISYGVYLLHWPVFLWLNEARTGLDGAALFVLRVTVSIGAAALMFRAIELPSRAGGSLRTRQALLALPIAALALLVGVRWVTNDLPPPPQYLETRDPGTLTIREAPRTTTSTSTSTPTTTPAPTPPPAPDVAAAPTTPPPPPPPTTIPPRRAQRVLLVGDSVAASLEGALGDALTVRGISFATAAAPGCGLLTGDPASDDGVAYDFTTACNDAIPPNQTGAIQKVGPDLVVAMSSWESGGRIVDGRFLPAASPESDAELLRLYGEMIRRVSSGGAAVAFATVPETTDTDTRTADSEKVRRMTHANALLDVVAANDPGRVVVLPFARSICPTTPCPRHLDGVELRPRDGAHFDDPVGARLAAERLADMIAGLDLDALP